VRRGEYEKTCRYATAVGHFQRLRRDLHLEGCSGHVFYTNSLHEIPSRYRTKAKLLDVATGKKLPIGALPPEGQAGSGAMPTQTPAQQPQPQQTPVQQVPAQLSPVPANPAAQATDAVTPQPRLTRAQRRAQQRQGVRPWPARVEK